MIDREQAEALFLEHLDFIDTVASNACRRKGIVGADAEDFTSEVRMKLMEDDYAVVRRFVGTSEFKTYLTAVVGRSVVNFFREQRGRWRSSAMAERLGTDVVELERLVLGGGYSVQQAGEKLRTEGRTTRSDADLARLFGQLPVRTPLRPVVPEPATGMDAQPSESRADERVLEAEAGSERAKMLDVLRTAMGDMESEDRLIMQMHFAEEVTVADVARALSLEQKPLYRRVERLRKRLRGLLERAGLHRDDVRGLHHDGDEP